MSNNLCVLYAIKNFLESHEITQIDVNDVIYDDIKINGIVKMNVITIIRDLIIDNEIENCYIYMFDTECDDQETKVAHLLLLLKYCSFPLILDYNNHMITIININKQRITYNDQYGVHHVNIYDKFINAELHFLIFFSTSRFNSIINSINEYNCGKIFNIRDDIS